MERYNQPYACFRLVRGNVFEDIGKPEAEPSATCGMINYKGWVGLADQRGLVQFPALFVLLVFVKVGMWKIILYQSSTVVTLLKHHLKIGIPFSICVKFFELGIYQRRTTVIFCPKENRDVHPCMVSMLQAIRTEKKNSTENRNCTKLIVSSI
jgi:hypothetical protein